MFRLTNIFYRFVLHWFEFILLYMHCWSISFFHIFLASVPNVFSMVRKSGWAAFMHAPSVACRARQTFCKALCRWVRVCLQYIMTMHLRPTRTRDLLRIISIVSLIRASSLLLPYYEPAYIFAVPMVYGVEPHFCRDYGGSDHGKQHSDQMKLYR